MKRVIAGLIVALLAGTGGAAQVPIRLRFIAPTAVTSPLAASRVPSNSTTLPDPVWSSFGAGAIPARATICNTLGTAGQVLSFSQSVTLATINTAMAGCTQGQTVFLNTGTYALTGMLTMKTGVTLRGSGADGVKLSFSGTGSTCGQNSNVFVCFQGSGSDGESCCSENEANWTAGYAAGTSVITLSANTKGATRPSVGTIIVLDQLVDGITTGADRWPNIFSCQTINVCVQSGNGGSPQDGRGVNATARSQSQIVVVTAVAGNNFTVTPPIEMPEYRSGQTPGAFWATTVTTHDAGLENLWVQNDGTSLVYSISGQWTRNDWIKGVKSVNAFNGDTATSSLRNTSFWYSSHITVRDSYFFGGTQPGSQDDYGVNLFVSGNALIENNICQMIRACFNMEQGMASVTAYNYAIHMISTVGAGSLQDGWDFSGSFDNHGVAGDFHLIEGNDDVMIDIENYHGIANFITAFRNHAVGQDASNATNQTAPIMHYGYSRFTNLIGNILGKTGYHTHYQFVQGDGQGQAACEVSIFNVGSGGDCFHETAPSTPQVGFPVDDVHSQDSLYRWGNCDAVNGFANCRFVSGEVPSGLTNYAQPVPSAHTLPSSLYLPSKPAFFGSHAWPPIGPDVSGGDVTGAGGHVWRIPARVCFEDVMGGTYGDTTAKSFNASACGF